MCSIYIVPLHDTDCIIITNNMNDNYVHVLYFKQGQLLLHVYFLLERNLWSVLLERVRCKGTGRMLRCLSCTCYNNVDVFIFDTDGVPYYARPLSGRRCSLHV